MRFCRTLGDFVGDVIVVFRIMPKGPGDIQSVKKALESLKPQRLEEEPIAFGLVALKLTKIVPDSEGGLSNFEQKLKNIKNVQNVETVTISRSL